MQTQTQKIQQRLAAKKEQAESGPMPFSQLQKLFNDRFYMGRNPRGANPEERLGFGTPTQDVNFAKLCAKEFAQLAAKKQGALRIDEFGAADGTFAKNFLDALKRDAPETYGRVEYFAWDKSDALLGVAQKALEGHKNAHCGIADATSLRTNFREASSDFVYCHELFDDLPSTVVVNREGGLKELWFYRENFTGAGAYHSQYKELPRELEQYFEIEKFMQNVPEKIRVSFPVAGICALFSLRALLKKGGVLRVTDYGYISGSIIPHMAIASKNGYGRTDLMPAGYAFVGGSAKIVGKGEYDQYQGFGADRELQVTTPVNFPFLKMLAKKIGFRANIEPHLAWAGRIAGEPCTTPSQNSQGLAYWAGSRMDEIVQMINVPRSLMNIVHSHKVFADKAVAQEIKNITARMGETAAALDELLDKVFGRFEAFGQPITRRSLEGKEGFIGIVMLETLANWLLQPTSPYASIVQKAKKPSLETTLITVKSEEKFRLSFSREIKGLENAGFDRDELYWRMFALPCNYKISGSLLRVSFTATKK